MQSGVLSGLKKQPYFAQSDSVLGAGAVEYLAPETNEENAILIQSPSWDWGTGGPGDPVAYGQGQALVLLAPDSRYASSPATDTPLAQRVLARLDAQGGFGLASGMHVATGRNIPLDGSHGLAPPTQHVWFDGGYQDVTGIVLVQHAAPTKAMGTYQNSAGQALQTQDQNGHLLVGSPDNAVRYLGVQDSTGSNRVLFIGGPGQFGARAIITSGAAALVPLALQGVASQTSDLQEWQNSTGQVLAKVFPSGAFVTASPDAAARGFYAQDGSNNTVALISGQPTPFGAHIQVTSGATGNILAYLKQIAAQTGDSLGIANSAGTNLFAVLASGQIKSAAANEATGAGSAALGANSPAVTNTAPYKWLKHITSDGSQVYVPAWK